MLLLKSTDLSQCDQLPHMGLHGCVQLENLQIKSGPQRLFIHMTNM